MTGADGHSSRSTTGLILAGGQGRRMGGADKGLVDFRDQPLVEHVAARLRPQVQSLLVSANRNLDRYRWLGCPVVADRVPGYAGPLAGIAAAMDVAATHWLLCAPCDAPFLPADYAQRMHAAQREARADIAMAVCGRSQPVFALLHRDLLPDLEAALAAGVRGVEAWYRRHRLVEVEFGDQPDAFLNVNQPLDRATAPGVPRP